MASPITYNLRFDMRAPDFGPSSEQLFAAALEMSEYADKHGFASVTLSEHHGSSDGYNPSPIVLGGGIAARTRHLYINLGALIVPLHDPLRVAEDIAVLDLMSHGRTIVIAAGGYVPSEFAMFNRSLKDRGRLVEEAITTLRKAWTGQPFEYQGRTVQVRPRPSQEHLPILMGGSAPVAARRAARIADGFMTHSAELYQVYFDEATRLGKNPRPFIAPGPGLVHVTEHPDQAWEQLAPHAMHEMNAYGSWAEEAGLERAAYHRVNTLDELKASGGYAVVTPDECLELARRYRRLMFHPLMGGTPPELGWSSLKLFVEKVLPRLKDL